MPQMEMPKPCSYEYDRKLHRLKINCLGCMYGASIEDFEECMSRVIDKLMQIKGVQSVVLSQTRDFEYDYPQTSMLQEIASTIKYYTTENKLISIRAVTPFPNDPEAPARIAFIQNLLLNIMKRDPIGAYITLLKEIKKETLRAKVARGRTQQSINHYLQNALLPLKAALENTQLINLVKSRLDEYRVGDRSIYREIFHPIIRPNFMFTRFMLLPPSDGKEIDSYTVGKDIKVQIFKLTTRPEYQYHIIPPELALSEDEYVLLDAARQYLGAHKPTRAEFAEPERAREIFFNIGKDLLLELAEHMRLEISTESINKLANILARYTAGYGILEVLMADEKVQDLYINAPIGTTPIFLFHSDYEECITNIIPTQEDAEAWATRFRIESGRPLDESNPVLDTEMITPYARVRVAAITRSLSPDGYAFAFRRHRDKPWTMPLFIHNRMLNPLAAGLISFIIDGARTILYAGTRSAGKTSLLGSTLTEILPRYRIVTVEDTLELPVEYLRRLGYNIARLKSRSIITHVESELPTDEALRVSLRLGDSCLILGEVRSVEARALYEAMRIGALANVVAGTIHGDSPYGVFDRVVNDLEVPPTSFKATDIIVIANRLRSADGLHTFRRVVEITEVRKDWSEDPVKEGAFVPLMVYDAKKDELVPTETLLNGESLILNEIAKRVKEWRDDWEAVWNNIEIRAKMKEELVNVARQTGNLAIMEADFYVRANVAFHIISERVIEEYGTLDNERAFNLWRSWLRSEVKKL